MTFPPDPPERPGPGPYGPAAQPGMPPGPPGPPPYPPYAYGPGQGFAPGPPPRSRGPLIVIAAVSVLALLAGAVVLVLLVSRKDDAASSGPRALKAPIWFQRVAAENPGACSSGGTPATDAQTCYQLVPGGVLAAGVNAITLQRPDPGRGRTGWSILLELLRPAVPDFARLSTAAAAAEPGQPQNQIAMVVDGEVVSAPSVSRPITDGRVEIQGLWDEKTAKQLFRKLTGSDG